MKTLTKIALGIMAFAAPAAADTSDKCLEPSYQEIRTEKGMKSIILEDKNCDQKYDSKRTGIYQKYDKSEFKKGNRIFLTENTVEMDTDFNNIYDYKLTQNMKWSKDSRILERFAIVENKEKSKLYFTIKSKSISWSPSGLHAKDEIIEIDCGGDGTVDYTAWIKRYHPFPDDPRKSWILEISTEESIIERHEKGKTVKVKDEEERNNVFFMGRYAIAEVMFGFSGECKGK